MTQEQVDIFLHKNVLLLTLAGFVLTGTLEYNDKFSYPEDLYMLLTGNDTKYFVNPEEIERIVDYTHYKND